MTTVVLQLALCRTHRCVYGALAAQAMVGWPYGRANHSIRDIVQRLDLFVKSLLKGHEMKTQEG